MTELEKQLATRIYEALEYASRYGQIDGGHHKMWVIDHMVHKLLGGDEAYEAWVKDYCNDDEYEWDKGIAP